MLITYAVLARTPIGVAVSALKLGVKPALLGVHAAYKVVEVEEGKTEPAATLVPVPSAEVFQPENV